MTEGVQRIRTQIASIAQSRLIPEALERFMKDVSLNRRRISGVPEGITMAQLDDLCRRTWQRGVVAARFAPISSWKGSSASYLWLQLDGGETYRVVFKSAIYPSTGSPDPDGFPVNPGPPEFWVYGTAAPVLKRHLPVCMLSSRHDGMESFAYVLEDLTRTYRKPPTRTGWSSGIRQMYDIHDGLSHAVETHGDRELLNYGPGFALGLLDFARVAIGRFQEIADDSVSQKVLDEWAGLSDAYVSTEFDLPELLRPIHGDYNTGNVFVASDVDAPIKVVDWEWTGIGFPHMDLAAHLRAAPSNVIQAALADLSNRYPDISIRTHERIFTRCELERGLWDAGLLAAQLVSDSSQIARLEPGVSRSLSKVLHAFGRLVASQ
ncbi:MAG: phosphotransferase [Acidimicrobiia bacterium]